MLLAQTLVPIIMDRPVFRDADLYMGRCILFTLRSAQEEDFTPATFMISSEYEQYIAYCFMGGSMANNLLSLCFERVALEKL